MTLHRTRGLSRVSAERLAAAIRAGSTFTGKQHAQTFARRADSVPPPAGASQPPRKRPRDTGPSRKVRDIVLERDGYACARCGKPCGPGIAPHSLQHRKARGVGGDSLIPNLLLLCGSATTGCHGEVESRDPATRREDQARGYRLESWQEPGLEPVMYFGPGGSGFTAWLADDGSLVFEAPAGGEAA